MNQRAARGTHLGKKKKKTSFQRFELLQYPHSNPVAVHEMIQNLESKISFYNESSFFD